jgi:hypothetical protein
MTRRLMDESFSTRQRARCTTASLRAQTGGRNAHSQGRSSRVACLWSQVIGCERRRVGRLLAPVDYHREEKE